MRHASNIQMCKNSKGDNFPHSNCEGEINDK